MRHLNHPLFLFKSVQLRAMLQDVSYDVDFRQLLRTNRSTGQQHRIRWAPHTVEMTSKLNGMAVGGSSGGKTQYQWETWFGLETGTSLLVGQHCCSDSYLHMWFCVEIDAAPAPIFQLELLLAKTTEENIAFARNWPTCSCIASYFLFHHGFEITG